MTRERIKELLAHARANSMEPLPLMRESQEAADAHMAEQNRVLAERSKRRAEEFRKIMRRCMTETLVYERIDGIGVWRRKDDPRVDPWDQKEA